MKNSISITCLTKNINIIIDSKINYNTSDLIFWLERFIPGVKVESGTLSYQIIIKKDYINSIVYDKQKTIISGNFEGNFESYIAKYVAQIMASLIIEDGYLLINCACVTKNAKALLIVGDYWQGKSSVAFSMVDNFNYEFLSDNYIIIKDGYVIKGTKYISFREENNKLKNKIEECYIKKCNNRVFYKIYQNDNKYKIEGIVTPHINESDNNIHIVSREESCWYLYSKFSKLINGECLLFNGSIPSPILNDKEKSVTILNVVNTLLDNNQLIYLSSSLDNITKYINNKIMVNGLEYNFAIKLTTACPGNCSCCINRKDNFKFKDKTKKLFDINTYTKICKLIKNVGGEYICLSGGEPTIIKNLSEYIKIASNFGLNVRLNTSGFGITKEKLDEWLILGLGQIVLSIYSLDKKTTLKTRGNLMMYEKTINAAKIISDAKEKNNFVFIVQSVIMKDNYLEIADIFKFAVEHNADMYWPSYLEDAINLNEIRLTQKDIKEFRKKVIPKMKEIVKNAGKYVNSDKIIEDVEKIYNKTYKDYIYHNSNINCPWPGKHFTFYPEGIVDPCPGHEYFKSKCQWKIDYNNIDEFFTKENLEKNMLVQYDYCKYCPQGEHKAVCLTKYLYHEHGRKEDYNG